MNTSKPATKHSPKTVVAFLAMAASFIRAGGLQKLLKIKPRFDTDECHDVIAKQWRDVMFSVRGAIGRIEEPSLINEALANLFDEQIKVVCRQFNEPAPAKGATTFKVARTEQFIDAYMQKLSPALNEEIRTWLSGRDQSHYLNSFDVREILCSIAKFGAMMHTLAVKTEFPAYEAFLERKMNEPGWFTNGYPYDMLVHDIADLRNSKEIGLIGIYSYPERCSTYALRKGETPCADKTLLVTAA